MSLPGLTANSQQEEIENELASRQKVVKEKLRLPGIEKLHLKSKEDIGAILANVIKSRSGVVSIKFVIGEYIELEYDSNPMNQLRG